MRIVRRGGVFDDETGCVKKKYLTHLFICSTLAKVSRTKARKDTGKMERIFEQGLLYDFYGELLTKHQRRLYEEAVYNDMSLSEIAEEEGISRQGVHDLIKRCDKILCGYEEKLHLAARFAEAKKTILEALKLTETEILHRNREEAPQEGLLEVKELLNRLLEEL